MTHERWDEVIAHIEESFGITDQGSDPTDDGVGTETWVVFVSPGGTMKLVCTSRPRLVGEKTQYSHRIGGQVTIDKVYDDSDQVSFVKGYRFDTQKNNWVEIDYPL